MCPVDWMGRSLTAIVAMIISPIHRCSTNLQSLQPHHSIVGFVYFVLFTYHELFDVGEGGMAREMTADRFGMLVRCFQNEQHFGLAGSEVLPMMR